MNKNYKSPLFLAACFVLTHFAFSQQTEAVRHWPFWRGPLLTGEAPYGNPPVVFGPNQNIRWKVDIPGEGLATPVIWSDKIFILSAVDTDHDVDAFIAEKPTQDMPAFVSRGGGKKPESVLDFKIICLNRKDGSILWQKTLHTDLPHAGTHADGTWASPSPVTDGEHVFAFFGSHGLFCLDMNGNLLWEKHFGLMSIRASFGEGSSPFLYKDKIIINWDHEEDSFITVLDKATGREIWRKSRDEVTSWATPVVIEVEGKPQIVVAATGKSRGYDLETGDIVWELGGMTYNVVPTPVHADGIVYLMSGFRGNAMQAVHLKKAKGNIEGTDAVVWTYGGRDTPYTPSSLLYRGNLYFFRRNDEWLSVFDAKTGIPHYGPVRLEDMRGVYASPAAADGRVYIAGRNGKVYVIEDGKEFKVLHSVQFDEGFDASPVIVDNELYLRSLTSLYCFTEN